VTCGAPTIDATAAATVALAAVAAVQIGREIYRDRQRIAGIRRCVGVRRWARATMTAIRQGRARRRRD